MSPANLPARPKHPDESRSLWIAMILLTSTIIGISASAISFFGGGRVPDAVLTGGSAFAVSVSLCLALRSFAVNRN